MFLMIHLYQIAQLVTNGHHTFKQLSESVAQIMSREKLIKTPSSKPIWTVVELYSQPPVLKQDESSNINLF